MYLKRFETLNWGTLVNNALDFTAACTLVTGASGSGKTMLLDAIQTVFSGASGNLHKYNSSQSESADKRKVGQDYRTLAGYVLGQLGSTFQRQSAHAWLVTVMAPSPGEERPAFSAVVGFEATREDGQPALTQTVLYLVRGEVSRHQLLVPGKTQERTVLAVKGSKVHLEGVFGSKAVEFFSVKEEFLCHLYGWLRAVPRVSAVEAKGAAKALVRAMAFRQMDSVSDTIKNEILEPKDLSAVVEQTCGIMRQMQSVTEQARKAETAKRQLETLEGHIAACRKQFVMVQRHELASAILRLKRMRRHEQEAHAQMGQCEELLGDLEIKQAAAKQLQEGLQAQLRSVETQRGNLPAHTERSNFNNRVRAAEQDIARCGRDLAAAVREAIRAQQDWAEMSAGFAPLPALKDQAQRIDALFARLGTERVAYLLQVVTRTLTGSTGQAAAGPSTAEAEELARSSDLVQLAQGRFTDYARAVREGDESLLSCVSAAQYATRSELQDAKLGHAQVIRTIALLSSGRSVLPEAVDEAVIEIRGQYPGANPRVLAEDVEPVEGSSWIGAVEGFIGANRFAIIVDEEYEKPVQWLLRRLPKDRFRPKVLQIRRLREEGRRHSPVPGCILEELKLLSPQAKAYLTANYGNAIKVEADEDIHKVARGITQDGLKMEGYGVQRFDVVPEAARAFGAIAREQQLKAACAQRDVLQGQITQLTQAERFLANCLEQLKRVTVFDLAHPFSAVRQAQQERALAQEGLVRLDTTELAALDAAHAQLSQRVRTVVEDIIKLATTQGSEQHKLAEAKAQLQTAQEDLPAREQEEQNSFVALSRLASFDATLDIEAERKASEKLGAQIGHADRVFGQWGHERNQLATLLRTLRDGISEYNRTVTPAQVLSAQILDDVQNTHIWDLYGAVQEAAARRQELFSYFDGHLLSHLKEEMRDIEQRFTSIFTANFIQTLCSAIEEGVVVLDELSATLRGRAFGNDTYRMHYELIPQYKRYYDFYRAISERSAELTDKTIFELELPEDLAAVRKEIGELLRQPDGNAAQERLRELTDWRNYRKYDMEIRRNDLPDSSIMYSVARNSSGGENQTPFYVLRAAILSAAHRHRDDSESHLKMLLLDEAFLQMDEAKTRESVRVQLEMFGLQVIVIIPTKSAGAVKPLIEREYQAMMVDGSSSYAKKRITYLKRVDIKPLEVQRLNGRTFRDIAGRFLQDTGFEVDGVQMQQFLEEESPMPPAQLRAVEPAPSVARAGPGEKLVLSDV